MNNRIGLYYLPWEYTLFVVVLKLPVVLLFHDSPCIKRYGLITIRVLGKYSTIRKNTRLLSEFQNHLSVNVSGSRLAIARDYFDMLNRYVSIPLMEGNVHIVFTANW